MSVVVMEPQQFFDAVSARQIAESPALQFWFRRERWSVKEDQRNSRSQSALVHKVCAHCGAKSQRKLRDNGQPYYCSHKRACVIARKRHDRLFTGSSQMKGAAAA